MSVAGSSREALRRRLGPTDELQIRLLMSVPPERRVRTMASTAAVIMNSLRDRLRRAHPELSDLELCRLMFGRLYRNG
jgi:hypothetical protein